MKSRYAHQVYEVINHSSNNKLRFQLQNQCDLNQSGMQIERLILVCLGAFMLPELGEAQVSKQQSKN